MVKFQQCEATTIIVYMMCYMTIYLDVHVVQGVLTGMATLYFDHNILCLTASEMDLFDVSR